MPAEIPVGAIVFGPLLSEPVEVLTIVRMGDSIKLIGKGRKTGLVRDPILSPAQVAQLRFLPLEESFDGDPAMFRLGIEARRLGLAYEYDPYFSLSIARVDPLPHQLEAVHDYFLKLPRIRFLPADDPGAGKTIMAGLLLKELKARGLVRRTLIVAPANLTFQWQRELKDKFREGFEVVRGETLRINYGQNPWQERDQEVKGRAGVGEIALTANEYKTAGRLKADYWLYAVFNCAGTPEMHAVQDPAKLGWKPVVQVEHYHVGPEAIRQAAR